MRKFGIFFALLPLAANAQQICFDAPDGFRFIRCVDMLGTASCEFLSSSDGVLRCVALDQDGNPIAVTNAFAEQSAAMFQDVDASTIETVVCD